MNWTWDQAKAVGIRDEDHWPYGPNLPTAVESRQALIGWAAENRLQLAAPRARCLHWVVGEARRCSHLQNQRHPGTLLTRDIYQVLDHPTFWTRDGKPALILAQPYGLPPQSWADAITAEWDVDVELQEQGPWYRAGTAGIYITPKVRTA